MASARRHALLGLLAALAPARLSAAAAAVAAAAPPNVIPASSGAVWVSGRCNRNSADGSISFDWLCAVHVNVARATYVRALLNATGGAHARFSATLDGAYETASFYVGAADAAANAATASFLVASGGLGAGPRLLQLRNVPEPVFAGVGPGAFFTFSGFETDGEAADPTPSARSIEVVGDSISAGFGSRGSAARALQCQDVDINNSGQTYTYGQLLANTFGADLSNIAWSCKGMLENGCGDTGEAMPSYYLQAFAGRPAVGADAWPFTKAPSLLLLNLGQVPADARPHSNNPTTPTNPKLCSDPDPPQDKRHAAREPRLRRKSHARLCCLYPERDGPVQRAGAAGRPHVRPHGLRECAPQRNAARRNCGGKRRWRECLLR